MNKFFEMPELLTLDGSAFTGDMIMGSGDPNTCSSGCDKGCGPGGCFPGSSLPDL